MWSREPSERSEQCVGSRTPPAGTPMQCANVPPPAADPISLVWIRGAVAITRCVFHRLVATVRQRVTANSPLACKPVMQTNTNTNTIIIITIIKHPRRTTTEQRRSFTVDGEPKKLQRATTSTSTSLQARPTTNAASNNNNFHIINQPSSSSGSAGGVTS